MRRIITLVITLVLMASLLSVAGVAAQDNTSPVITKIEAESATITPVKWGVDHGIISGTNNGIEPQGNATRVQIEVIIRACENNVRV